MPTVSVERDVLFTHMGREYTEEAFDHLCFEFGIELDEVTSEREEAIKAGRISGDSATAAAATKQSQSLSDAVIYKIDVPANRYDLLCVEGLSRALRVFLGDMDAPVYRFVPPPTPTTDSLHTMTVHKSHTDTIRPFVVCAILRDITFDQQRYESFIDLQDQLHRNLCRQRTLVAIGTHDLDSIQPPFVYDARAPRDIHFVPLTPDDRSFHADELLRFYETDVTAKHLKPYVGIIKDSPRYPVILDSLGTVLSLPPIINGSHSKIKLTTKNVFIECTATDLTKANIVLDTVVTMFSEYCSVPFTVEPVVVNYMDEKEAIVDSYTTPVLSTRRERAGVDFVNSMIGIQISPQEMMTLCNKIQLGPATLLDHDQTLEVTVPPTRSDILHAVDIAEDIGIAFGYNNIVKRVPKTCTVGGEFPLNQLSDLLRDEIARAGYIEILTHGLCSTEENFTALRREITTTAVSLLNPANVEYEVVRTTLLPGLLKTLQHNKSASFTNGFKIFEISDVILRDDQHTITETIVGARNLRRVCAVYAGPKSGFEIIHGLVDRIMMLTEVAPDPNYIASSARKSDDEDKYRVCREGWSYTIAPLDDTDPVAGTYFAGRAATVWLTTPARTEPVPVGTFGILHPDVLQYFDIQYPASSLELDLEMLLL